MLTNEQERLWHKYQAAERAKARKESLQALEDFISSMTPETIDVWAPWAFKVAEDVVDHGSGFPIRQPLFEKVILPALAQGVAKREAGCARWLAGCAQLINTTSKEVESLGGPYGLLKIALSHAPSDPLAKDQLIALLARDLEYSIHELPSGVLNNCGNGATIEQCSQLQDDLKEFIKLVNERGVFAKYQRLIELCSFHFKHYSIYLREKDRFATYKSYLKTLPVSIPVF